MRFILTLTLGTNAIGALILFSISYLSFKALKMTKVRFFLFLFLGFSILGVDSFLKAVIFSILLATPAPRIVMYVSTLTLSILSTLAEVFAYILIALGYTDYFRSYGKLFLAAPIVPVLAVHLSGLIIAIFLLLYIVFQAFTAYVHSRKRNQLSVMVGFSTILLSRILRLIAITAFSDSLFIASNLVYFAGLLCFLIVVLMVTRSGKETKV